MSPGRLAALLLASSVPLALPACAQPPATPPAGAAMTPVQPRETDGCNAAAAQFLLGQRPTPGAVERARQQAGARQARVLAFDEVVTQEYRAGRLTLRLGEDGRIAQISCG